MSTKTRTTSAAASTTTAMASYLAALDDWQQVADRAREESGKCRGRPPTGSAPSVGGPPRKVWLTARCRHCCGFLANSRLISADDLRPQVGRLALSAVEVRWRENNEQKSAYRPRAGPSWLKKAQRNNQVADEHRRPAGREAPNEPTGGPLINGADRTRCNYVIVASLSAPCSPAQSSSSRAEQTTGTNSKVRLSSRANGCSLGPRQAEPGRLAGGEEMSVFIRFEKSAANK